jgi:hypothetical protein
MENLRDRFEDYELLAVLQEARTAAGDKADPAWLKEADALLVLDGFMSNWGVFDETPGVLERYRLRIIGCIEKKPK